MQSLRVHITGVVQGVGFRPFVYNLAARLGIKGWVNNTSAGVFIRAEGSAEDLKTFLEKLSAEKPPLAAIDKITVEEAPPEGFASFEIQHSTSIEGAFQPVSPDVTVCEDCLRELFDPNDRRYRYPFINCTNCGPRFTIIQDIPYDRPKTTMAGFALCPDCLREYQDPADRRFHAQPVACPKCGPRIWLESPEMGEIQGTDDAIDTTRKLLNSGKIVAVKGLGGFHLACDATNPAAVSELRARKLRVDKPFALMFPDLQTVERHCFVNDDERALLQSAARPITLLKRRPESNVAEDVSPKNDWLGVMLPYAPLHYLLFADSLHPASFALPPLVMTSGNLSEEPIATENEEARQRLARLADAFLTHNRDIHIRCDDSVVRVFADHSRQSVYPIRRSRGYAPFPVKLPFQSPPILAAGAELKNVFCVANGEYAFMSHHIGDMENYETLRSFEQGVTHFENLFRAKPKALAYDLHPNYLATRYALERAERENLPAFGIQHHHAHIAACAAEHGLDEPVLGFAFDGTGYGEDGAIWGGEALVADYAGYQRAAHLEYFPLPGGDAAIKRPARTALALLWSLGLEWDEDLPPAREFCAQDLNLLRNQLEKNINAPQTSSMGRLFDAAAALAGIRQKVNYEGQAAIEFEALARDFFDGRGYRFRLENGLIRVGDALRALIQDARAGISPSEISARFHLGLAEVVLEIAKQLRAQTSISSVALSGGVWQNIALLRSAAALLEKEGFKVYVHRQVPTNDGGLALGQAAIAAKKFLIG